MEIVGIGNYNQRNHQVLECDHPIMPSRNVKNTWTGNGHFIKANQYIMKHYSPQQTIVW
jgi:uracil DNA glycosylase